MAPPHLLLKTVFHITAVAGQLYCYLIRDFSFTSGIKRLKAMLYSPKKLPLSVLLCEVLFLCLIFPANTHAEGIPEWQPEAQRDENRPIFQAADKTSLIEGMNTLAIRGNGSPSANGWWTKTVSVSPEKHYGFRTYFLAEDVDNPSRSILARVIWQDVDGNETGLPEYPATLLTKKSGGWGIIQQNYYSPPGAVTARLELVFRWDIDGRVFFRHTSFTEISPPALRKVRISSIHFRPRSSKSARENLEKFAAFVAEAAEKKADIVCLPEGITLVGTGKNYLETSEPVPGPTTDFMGRIAEAHNLYIVANIYEREGEAVYNTSVLLDRKGKIAGKYRKVCLPREEIDGGLTPGDSFPVFATDFGMIGLMTCWDVFFPEPARILSRKGAEIIFMPIWGGNLTLAKARAIENQIYLVSSSYDMKTGIFDHEGNLIVEGTENNPVAIKTIDMNKRTLWPWLGDFKNRIPREKPPARSMEND
jgi:predicted amidohydrolase